MQYSWTCKSVSFCEESRQKQGVTNFEEILRNSSGLCFLSMLSFISSYREHIECSGMQWMCYMSSKKRGVSRKQSAQTGISSLSSGSDNTMRRSMRFLRANGFLLLFSRHVDSGGNLALAGVWFELVSPPIELKLESFTSDPTYWFLSLYKCKNVSIFSWDELVEIRAHFTYIHLSLLTSSFCSRIWIFHNSRCWWKPYLPLVQELPLAVQ